jgi:DNA-binding CsgD family transcriptional regulator
MSNTTTGGVFAADSLRDARVALRAANYDAATDLLQGCEDWPADLREPALILKAEIMGRRNPVAAVSYLTTIEDLVSSEAGRFGLALQFGKAHASVRAFSQAESRYADARALAHLVPDGDKTMAYHDLRMRWFRRECDPAAPEAALAITHPDPNIASAAYAFRAWLHAGRQDYDAHVADLVRAVDVVTSNADSLDVGLVTPSIHALALMGFETANGDAVAAARRAADAIAWTADVGVNHYFTIRAFGWDAFMRGRAGEAQWAFKDARMRAPSVSWRVMSHLDRAYVARISRNEFWAAEELAQADALAYDVRWGETHGEERQVLVTLAVLHAPTDAPRAQRYASMYSQIGTENVDPSLAIHNDPRAAGFEQYALGRIEQTMGRREPAVRALKAAYAVFERASFHYQASLSASALAELTGEEGWRKASAEHAGRYPNSPLASFTDEGHARNDAMPQQLSPLQRQIAAALWTGAETPELSRRFSRSAYTIENQVTAVLKAFGVESKRELLDEARRRGLV